MPKSGFRSFWVCINSRYYRKYNRMDIRHFKITKKVSSENHTVVPSKEWATRWEKVESIELAGPTQVRVGRERWGLCWDWQIEWYSWVRWQLRLEGRLQMPHQSCQEARGCRCPLGGQADAPDLGKGQTVSSLPVWRPSKMKKDITERTLLLWETCTDYMLNDYVTLHFY